MRVFSFGGGVQSTACLVLAAQGRIDYKTFLFCNVGDDSENPDTLAYVRDHSVPYAAKHGIEFVELRKHRKDGTPETLLERINRSQRSIPIPVRMQNGAPGNRQCTGDFKIRLVAKEVKRRGATAVEPATVGLGISVDEVERSRNDSGIAWTRLDYPLLHLGLFRKDCIEIIRGSGLPIPPKSSCYFCPFHSLKAWSELRTKRPDLFAKSVEIERSINAKRDALGKYRVFMCSRPLPLDQAVAANDQLEMPMDNCDSGYCFT